LRIGLAEGECKSLHARTEKLDLEPAVGDGFLLSDQLVETLPGQGAVALFVNVKASWLVAAYWPLVPCADVSFFWAVGPTANSARETQGWAIPMRARYGQQPVVANDIVAFMDALNVQRGDSRRP
jgi:hypothetical protein